MSSKEGIGGLIGVALTAIPGIGTGIGAITALQGFQLGAAAAGLLFPPESPSVEQGKLSDIRGTGSSQGVPIPKVFGRQRVGGVVFYMSDVTEKKVNEGGGGGGKK